ncbi:MAG: class I SAM-dependent methyltransferase [Candidatus Paceibacterota bacterium]|jgi:ubiquinone/menaquinone biosynthesis C-methylase UbiE
MFSDPGHNIQQLGISDGMIVADLGSGSGFYSLEAAKAVAPMGKVYAVDVQRDMLERLKKEAQRFHVRNIDVIVGDLERLGGTKIREGSCDVVIVSNVLFMIEDKKSFLSEAKRILKHKGRVLLIDWSASFSHMGPHPEHVVYKDAAIKLLTEAGLVFEREISAGAQHYGIISRKQ